MESNSFDPLGHEYRIDGRPVPSVTQVIREVLGDAIWQASDWHLQRGRAVHACAALIAQGKNFEHDAAIAGPVAACKKWFADFKPEVWEIEQPRYSKVYQFAGTPDLIARIGKTICVIDWKSALSDLAMIQLCGYGILAPEATRGLVVELGEGDYRLSAAV